MNVKCLKEAAITTINEHPEEVRKIAFVAATGLLLAAHTISLCRLSREVSKLSADMIAAETKIGAITGALENHSRQLNLAHFLEDSNTCALGARIDFLANKLKCLEECNKAGYDAAMAFASANHINEARVAEAMAEGVATLKIFDL